MELRVGEKNEDGVLTVRRDYIEGHLRSCIDTEYFNALRMISGRELESCDEHRRHNGGETAIVERHFCGAHCHQVSIQGAGPF